MICASARARARGNEFCCQWPARVRRAGSVIVARLVVTIFRVTREKSSPVGFFRLLLCFAFGSGGHENFRILLRSLGDPINMLIFRRHFSQVMPWQFVLCYFPAWFRQILADGSNWLCTPLSG